MSTKLTMDELLAESDLKTLKAGDVLDATITSIKKHEMWLDLGPYGVGVVMRREIGYGQQLEVGQSISASVVDPEIEDGYALLSLKKAAKDRGWDELKRVMDDGEILEITPYDANRGGLLI